MIEHLKICDIQKLPSPLEVLKMLPVSESQKTFIANSRQTIRNILDNKDSRLLIISGPCSIHDFEATKEYAKRLKKLASQIQETCYLIMRVYFEKPRTSKGWKGFLYDPSLNGKYHISDGLYLSRKLLLELAELEIAIATELLDPLSAYYYADLISWGCIGARTASSQVHRQLASSLPMPIAFKNSTDGNAAVAINGILCASIPHTFIGINMAGEVSRVQTEGNQDGHLVLRGSDRRPNYDPESIEKALQALMSARLPPRLLVDCSHGNSLRREQEQKVVFRSVFNQIIEGNHNIRGVLLESHLNSGNQSHENKPLRYGTSITDPCLDWHNTEHLLLWGHAHLKMYDIPEALPSQEVCTG